MQKKIFLSQDKLDEWQADDKLSIDGDAITILSNDNPSYAITPSVKFVSIESKDEDPNNLVGLTISGEALKSKGVEVYMDSAIYNDDAYKVEQGFTGILIDGNRVTEEVIDLKVEEKIEEKAEEKVKSDDELLADFFLKNI